jgi:hypothetical protein
VAVLCSAGGALAAHLHASALTSAATSALATPPRQGAPQACLCAHALLRARGSASARRGTCGTWRLGVGQPLGLGILFLLSPARYPVQTGGKVRSAVHYITPITQHTCLYSVVRAPHHTKMAKNAAAARLRSPLKLPRQLHPPPPTRQILLCDQQLRLPLGLLRLPLGLDVS